MKKIGIILSAVVLVVIVALAAFWLMKGGDSADVSSSAEGPLELAVIDGESFAIDGGLNALKMRTLFYGSASVADQIQYLVEQEVIAKKAAAEGIVVSDEEVQAYVDQWLADFRQLVNSEGGEFYEKMLKDMGETDESFFQMFFDSYRNELLVKKYQDVLKEQVESGAAEPIDFLSYWQEFKETLMKDADVQYGDAYDQAADISLSDLYTP